MDTVRARIMAGEKSHLENAAYLPQLVVGKNKKGEPIRANFMYAIKCHKVHDKGGGKMPETNSTRQSVSIPFKRFRATSELHSKTGGLRRQLFEVDPTCSARYSTSEPWSTAENGKCKETNGDASYRPPQPTPFQHG